MLALDFLRGRNTLAYLTLSTIKSKKSVTTMTLGVLFWEPSIIFKVYGKSLLFMSTPLMLSCKV
jgi:hypothetical protein